MMTNPTLDDLLEGLIVSLENEIMPHVSSPKAHVMCQMVQSLIQEVRQALPVYDTYVAQEHNEMTQVLRDVAGALGDTAVLKLTALGNGHPHWVPKLMCQCRLIRHPFELHTENLALHYKTA